MAGLFLSRALLGLNASLELPWRHPTLWYKRGTRPGLLIHLHLFPFFRAFVGGTRGRYNQSISSFYIVAESVGAAKEQKRSSQWQENFIDGGTICHVLLGFFLLILFHFALFYPFHRRYADAFNLRSVASERRQQQQRHGI